MGSNVPLNSVLVAGVNTRPIVKSAKALGLKTIVVDCFDDIDLAAYSDILVSRRSLRRRKDLAGVKRPSLYELTLKALETHSVDGILLASGMEHNLQFMKELRKKSKIFGNKISGLKLCGNKKKLFQIADKLGIPHPQTERVQRLGDALKAAADIGYPVVLKPAFGGGGIGIRVAKSPEELERLFIEVLKTGDRKTLYVQEFIHGIDASASIMSIGYGAECLTVNEQIIGNKRLGAPRPFGYCGNVIPLNAGQEVKRKIAEYSQALCCKIGLIGSNGVDFVLSDNKPHLMEINPRFQGTIECVEGLLGVNLVEEHIRSCMGELKKYKKPNGYSAKLILYAKGDVKAPNLKNLPDIVDIPKLDSNLNKGEPICSVLKFSNSRQKVVADAFATAEKVYTLCKQ